MDVRARDNHGFQTLTKEAITLGYKDTVHGVEDCNEAKLTLVSDNTLWTKQNIVLQKDAVCKGLRAVNNAASRKRKTCHVYGVPLSGPALAKPGFYPEQKHCGEEQRKKWFEGLSQCKRPRALSEHVPSGVRKGMFEALFHHNVSFLRAMWFVKVVYLNVVRPPTGLASSVADKAPGRSKRMEVWTRDLISFMDTMLECACMPTGGSSSQGMKSASGGLPHQPIIPVVVGGAKGGGVDVLSLNPSTSLLGSQQGSSLSVTTTSQPGIGGSSPPTGSRSDIHAKWHYWVRLIGWQYNEGMINRAMLADWLLKQLQERKSLECWELLIPLVLVMVEGVALSQLHLRMLVDLITIWLKENYSVCGDGLRAPPPPPPPSRRLHTLCVSLIELLRYLIVSVPDSFVAFESFPKCVPIAIAHDNPTTGSGTMKSPGDRFRPVVHDNRAAGCGVHWLSMSQKAAGESTAKAWEQPPEGWREPVCGEVIKCVKERAGLLASAVNPAVLRNNLVMAVQALERALQTGDLISACKSVEDTLHGQLMGSTGWEDAKKGLVTDDQVVQFICEWGVSGLGHSGWGPTSPPPRCGRVVHGEGEDKARVYTAVSILRLKMEDLRCSGYGLQGGDGVQGGAGNAPGEMTHEMVFRWLDNHEPEGGAGDLNLHLLIAELAQEGMFFPDLYLHKLISEGILDKQRTVAERSRAWRHYLYLREMLITEDLEQPSCVGGEDGEGQDDLHGGRLRSAAAAAAAGTNPPETMAFLWGKQEEQSIRAKAFLNECHFVLHYFWGKRRKQLNRTRKDEEEYYIQKEEHEGGQVFPAMIEESDYLTVRKHRERIERVKAAVADMLHLPPEAGTGEWCRRDGASSEGGGKSEGADAKRKETGAAGEDQLHGGGNLLKKKTTLGAADTTDMKRRRVQKHIDSETQIDRAGAAIRGGDGCADLCPVDIITDEEELWWLKRSSKTRQEPNGGNQQVTSVTSPDYDATRRKEGGGGDFVSQGSDTALPGYCGRVNESESGSENLYHRCGAQWNGDQVQDRGTSGASTSVTAHIASEGPSRLGCSSGKAASISLETRRLSLRDKRKVSRWLDGVVRKLLGGSMRTDGSGDGNEGQSASGWSAHEAAGRWRLTEEEFTGILFVFDICQDYRLLVHFLLRLLRNPLLLHGTLAKPPSGTSGTPGKDRMGPSLLCRSCIGELSLVAGLRRYESMVVAMNLLPDMFSAVMVRAVELTSASALSQPGNGPLGAYAQDLLSRYKDIVTLGHCEGRWRFQLDHWVLGDAGSLRSGDSVNVDTGTDVHGIPRGDKMRGQLRKLANSILQSFRQVVHVAKGNLVGIERDAELGLKENLGRAELEKLRFKTMNRMDGVREVAMQVANAIQSFQSQNQHPQGVYIMAAGTALVISTVNCAVSMLQTLELGGGLQKYAQTARCAHRMIQMHVQSLAMVKEVLGPGLTPAMEDAVISEVLVQIHSAFGAGGRGVIRGAQQDSSAGGANTPVSAETAISAGGGGRGKQMMMAVGAAAFIVMAIVAGVLDWEKVIYSLRISEGLDQLQRGLTGLLSTASCGAGSKESSSRNEKTAAEVSLFLLRVLVGDCAGVSEGMVGDVVGAADLVGLTRVQRCANLEVVIRLGYKLFSAVIGPQKGLVHKNWPEKGGFWETLSGMANAAMRELIGHPPFREVCLRDSSVLYSLLSKEISPEVEIAEFLDANKIVDNAHRAFMLVPSTFRLFFSALRDQKMPCQQGDKWVFAGNPPPIGDLGGRDDSAISLKLPELVQILDNLQLGSFGLQWVELRLLLNEQVVLEKLSMGATAGEAIQAADTAQCKASLTDCEKVFIQAVVLTRLLTRPEAATLYSEAVRFLGRALEEQLISNVKSTVLENLDHLLGRRSLCQVLCNTIERFGLTSMMLSNAHLHPNRLKKSMLSWQSRKACSGSRRKRACSAENSKCLEHKELQASKRRLENGLKSVPFAAERALAELVLPRLASNSSTEGLNNILNDLIKQLHSLEQHISQLSRGILSQGVDAQCPKPSAWCGSEVYAAESSGLGQARRRIVPSQNVNVSTGAGAVAVSNAAAALQPSIWLRLGFLLPLLPFVYARDPWNMRHSLAHALLRLLATGVVQESMFPSLASNDCVLLQSNGGFTLSQAGGANTLEASAAATAAIATMGEGLFERLLSVFHALLSSVMPGWLKPKKKEKGSKVRAFEREIAEKMQQDLERFKLPRSIHNCIQAALPCFPLHPAPRVCAAPGILPSLTSTQAFPIVTEPQVSLSPCAHDAPPTHGMTAAQRALFISQCSAGGTPRAASVSAADVGSSGDCEVELDPWLLLEDGVASSSSVIGGPWGSSSGAGDRGNIKPCHWLKGAVRFSRMHLTYAGFVEDANT
ncbi:hypothetical protein CBR_g44444 [Chara braunii]|uniref:Mediator complex subunit Med12 domain-containing protein n=1 Tax=Chara braunii TaxID=69332 RepID=A0A388LXP1_CHABU|nr:hypothetical protein CBR_g44444 [Chara braunii]|eukprot:GBG86989.1 hypothetical protein CBR_g44444 [Chara braunii]